MIELLCVWFCFCVALYRSIRLITEMFEDNRNVKMLCSEHVGINKVYHPSFHTLSLFITAFAWAAFGLLLMSYGLSSSG